MDFDDSEIVFINEISDRKIIKDSFGPSKSLQRNGDMICEDRKDLDNCEDGFEGVSDFDDEELEVLDAWEDVDDTKEGEPTHNSEEQQLKEAISNPSTRRDHRDGSRRHNHEAMRRRQNCIPSEESSKIVSINVDSAEYAKATYNHSSFRSEKVGDKIHVPKKQSQERISSSISSCTPLSATESKKPSLHQAHCLPKDNQSSSSNTSQSNHIKNKSDVPTDPTESKVEKFLKEIALQHPRIRGLQDTLDDVKSLEPVSSDSSKDSCEDSVQASFTGSSHLQTHIDRGVSLEKTSTSRTSSAVESDSKQCPVSSRDVPPKDSPHKELWVQDTSSGRCSKPQTGGRYRSDRIFTYEGVGEKRSRSPCVRSKTNYSKRSSRSPPYKARRSSSAKSFSMSPSLSPRARPLSRSPVPNSRIPQSSDYNYSASNMHQKFSDRHLYQPALGVRSRYQASPVCEPSDVRELSRSLSRERLGQHSWSRSRSKGRLPDHHRSRSRHRHSSKEELRRRYRSRSPVRGHPSRSRSRSWSPQRFTRHRSPVMRDDRPRRSRKSRSRSRSPWKRLADVPISEWQSKYQNLNRVLPVKDDVQLEHVMERFIATNMAATGLIPPPLTDVRSWYEAEMKAQASSPSSQSVAAEMPVDEMQGGMPLPPPPPDISELMSGDDMKGPNILQEMSPEVSLSSLLESAVTGCPDKVILERCQDAIMKLHDYSVKPGRFAVIPSIKVPQAEPSSTFRPWQSVLNRFLATKIHFNYCKLMEQPVMWNSAKSKSNLPKSDTISPKEVSGALKDVPCANTLSSASCSTSDPSNSSDMDRAALLDKIFFLTRELQELRQSADLKASNRRSIGIQTESVNMCENCWKGNTSSSVGNTVQREHPSSSAFSANHRNNIPSRQGPSNFRSTFLPVGKSVPPASRASLPKLMSASNNEAVGKPAAAPSGKATQHPVPTSKPIPGAVAGQSNSPVASVPVTSKVSTAFESSCNPQHSSSTSHQPTDWQSTQQPSSSNTARTATVPGKAIKVLNPFIAHSSQPSAREQGGVIQPTQKSASATNSIPPLIPPNQQKKLKAADFDLSKCLMLGDEYMFDLISYLRSVGIQCNFDAKFCSTSLTVDLAMKAITSGPPPKQVVAFFGLYNGSFNSKVLTKYINLIGFLRKRCTHLILIEPPPIPKWSTGDMKQAWDSFTVMQAKFAPMKAENVSVVRVMPLLMLNPVTPNEALFTNGQRLNQEGLALVSNELQKLLKKAASIIFFKKLNS